MALKSGPNLNQLVDGAPGEAHYTELMRQWRAFDALIQPSVISRVAIVPTEGMADGDRYLLTGGANVNKIARYSVDLTPPGWEYYTPKSGWVIWSTVDGKGYRFSDNVWAEEATGGGGGGIQSIGAGAGIEVDDTDPANPIVSATGGGGGGGGDLPPGGTVGQVLAKASSEDFDVTWQTPSGGGGGGGITSPTINRIITSTNPDEPLEEGDLLVVLPRPRIVAATHSAQTYGDDDAVQSVDVIIPIDAKPGDMLLLLVASHSNTTPPNEFTLIQEVNSPRDVLSSGIGWSTAYYKSLGNEIPGQSISVQQAVSGRLSAVLLVVRSGAPIRVISTGTDSSSSPSGQPYIGHPIPGVVATDDLQMAVTTTCCALAGSVGDGSIEWPFAWVPITPQSAPPSPSHERLRAWVAYRYMQKGESTAGVTPHSTASHDGSSLTILLGV